MLSYDERGILRDDCLVEGSFWCDNSSFDPSENKEQKKQKIKIKIEKKKVMHAD